jgi:hypothetical protein
MKADPASRIHDAPRVLVPGCSTRTNDALVFVRSAKLFQKYERYRVTREALPATRDIARCVGFDTASFRDSGAGGRT